MNAATEVASTPDSPRFSIRRFLRSTFIEGGRFWERGRLAYNGTQLVLTGVMVLVRWPNAHYFASNLGTYVAFALVANAFYSAAYFPEAVLQIPLLRPYARPVRWCILIAGTSLACFLAALAMDAVILRDPTDD